MQFDIKLTRAQLATINDLPSEAWFTRFRFLNGETPRHPQAYRLEKNNVRKTAMVANWVERYAPGKRVLDLFSANGAFSFMAAKAGAASVVGVEADALRVRSAELVWSLIRERHRDTEVEFVNGSVYDLSEVFTEPFDVVMCFGGLYHIADPPYVLRQIRDLTGERLLVQTSALLPGRGNHARFQVRRDRRAEGLASIVGGSGRWKLSQLAFENILAHASFEVEERRRPHGFRLRRRFPHVERFPWYAAVCRPLQK